MPWYIGSMKARQDQGINDPEARQEDCVPLKGDRQGIHLLMSMIMCTGNIANTIVLEEVSRGIQYMPAMIAVTCAVATTEDAYKHLADYFSCHFHCQNLHPMHQRFHVQRSLQS